MATERIRIRKDSETDEWLVVWLTDGKRNEAKTYYTDEREDAIDTARTMLSRHPELEIIGKWAEYNNQQEAWNKEMLRRQAATQRSNVK